MQVKTKLGKLFEIWKQNNNGTDEQLMERLRATPTQYRELFDQVLKHDSALTTGDHTTATATSYPKQQEINDIANHRGISAAGLTSIIKSL